MNVLPAQSRGVSEEAIYAAIAKNDQASLKSLSIRAEIAFKAGKPLPGKSLTSSYGILAQAFFSLENFPEALRLYARAISAAHKEGLRNKAEGFMARLEYVRVLTLSNRETDAISVAERLLGDLRKYARDAVSPRYDVLQALAFAHMRIEDYEAAIEPGKALQRLGELQLGAADERTQLANEMLAQILQRAGRAHDAIPYGERSLHLISQFFEPTSERVIEDQLQFADILMEAGETKRAENLIWRVVEVAEKHLPQESRMRMLAVSKLAKLRLGEGDYFNHRVLSRKILDEAIEFGTPLDKLQALQRLSQSALIEGDDALYEDLLLRVVEHVLEHPELPKRHAGAALVSLAELQYSRYWNGEMAFDFISAARSILQEDPGPGGLEWLQAEASVIFLKFAEYRLRDNSKKAGRANYFWDGTAAGARFTRRELDILERRADAEWDAGNYYPSLEANINFAAALSEEGYIDKAIAVLKREKRRLRAERDAKLASDVNIEASITNAHGMTLMKARRFEEAAKLYTQNIGSMLGMLRNSRWLGPISDRDVFSQVSQIYGQSNAIAHWHSAAEQPKRKQKKYMIEAFKAVQLAGHGPAAASVSRARLRRMAEDSDVADLMREWDALSNFEAGIVDYSLEDSAARKAAYLNKGNRLSHLQKEILKRFPGFFDLQVPKPVEIGDLLRPKDGRPLIGDDEVIITIIPTKGAGDSYEVNGLVIALTKQDIAWSEMGMSARELTIEIAQYQAALDPFSSESVSRAPLGAVEEDGGLDGTEMYFPFHHGSRLYDAYFGHPDIAKLVRGKTQWTIIPYDIALTTPFSALIAHDPGVGSVRSPDDFRKVGWLGLERAISVFPSVVALKELRSQRLEDAPKPNISYLAFGDPNFEGGETQNLPSADAMASLRGDALISGVKALPRLPGTRQEVEALAHFFKADRAHVKLGAEASEEQLRIFNETGQLGRAKILHFATHGLLSGAFEGLSEPALALSPPSGRGGKGLDGLLTASEASMLNLSADWVILSACDTAGDEGALGDGLGGLVQGFFTAGARSLLVSHWPVTDEGAARLVTLAVKASEAGLSKSKALRDAMIDLAADKSNDTTGVSNAHPSIWAPFLLLGG